MDFPKIIEEIMETGMSETDIVVAVYGKGERCTQSHINKIRRGEVQPRYALGAALMAIWEEAE